jgi:sodium-dependent phosphate cotransporter
VGLAGAGLLPIESAIPIIMGANMGTTITNILVSLTFVTRKEDFRRAFAAATVHDFFNIFTIIVLLPLEVIFHPIEKSAVFLTDIFKGIGGIELTSPLKYILDPITNGVKHFLLNTFSISDVVAGVIILIVSLALIIVTLIYMVKTLRALTSSKVESYVDKYLFRNTFVALLLGMLLTAVVQSSSVTTSLIVPLVAAGVIGLSQAYPFTLGANIGTTVTAILASLATVSIVNGESVNAVGVTVAFAHLLFNIFGVAIFLPLKKIPITCATRLANFAAESKKWAFIFVIVLFYLLPLLLLLITR